MTSGLGWTLGDYVIGTPIDAGKFGTVYHAQHLPSGREVALKLIPLQGVEGDEKVAAERHGAMLQTRFCQAHRDLVPEVYEHQQIVTFYAIAMELVRGEQLTDVIARGPLPPKRAAEIALAICQFLEKAHKFETDIEGVHYRMIVHADLKPDHVLLREDGSIRVLDFGIAKALATRTLVTTNKWGSVHYASPERLQSDGHVNEHADFWSLGVMLFEMVAGFRPYRRYEHSVSRLDNAIRRGEQREQLPLTSDPVLATIVQKLLAPQIERRYASAESIAADLRAFLFGGPVAAAVEAGRAGAETVRVGRVPASPPTEPLPKSARPLAAAVGAATAGATAAGGMRPPAAGAASPAGAAATAAHDRVHGTGAPADWSRARRQRRGGLAGRWLSGGMRSVVLALGVMFVVSHLWNSAPASRFRSGADVARLEVSDIAAAREEYQRAGGASADGLGDRLKRRMIELADRAIVGYRTGAARIAEAQWLQARESLNFAAELAPRDTRVAAKQAYVRGHLLRISAGGEDDVAQAVAAFQESARLDPESPDPYLGLARIYAYASPDPDALTAVLDQAEERGYEPGARERAQVGDAYKVRADRARGEAAQLSGEDRAGRLQQAANDYERCIEHFEDLHFFNSDQNLRTCRRRLAAIQDELDRDRDRDTPSAPRPPGVADDTGTDLGPGLEL